VVWEDWKAKMLDVRTPGASSVNWLMSRVASGRFEAAFASIKVPSSVEPVCRSGGATLTVTLVLTAPTFN